MSTDPKQKQQSGKVFITIKYVLISLLVAAIAWLASIITFGSFVDINPKLYAKTFIAWRHLGGDAALLEGRYKGYKTNDYSTNEDFSNFIDLAQKKEALLITGNYPLHAPRGPEKLYTLIDKKKAVEDLWKVEFNLKCELLKRDSKFEPEMDKTPKNLKEYAIDTMHKSKIYDQKFKSKYFVEDSSITPNILKGFFFYENKESRWLSASKPFLTILDKLAKKEEGYNFVNGKVSDSLFSDIEDLLKTLGYNANDYKNEINAFFLNMGTVKATPFETFCYSRFYNLFNFLTINHKFDYKSIEKGEENKKDELHSIEKAGIFAQIFANVYEEDYKFELKDPSIKERFSKWFGTSQNVDDIKDQKDNIKASLKKANKNLDEMLAEKAN